MRPKERLELESEPNPRRNMIIRRIILWSAVGVTVCLAGLWVFAWWVFPMTRDRYDYFHSQDELERDSDKAHGENIWLTGGWKVDWTRLVGVHPYEVYVAGIEFLNEDSLASLIGSIRQEGAPSQQACGAYFQGVDFSHLSHTLLSESCESSEGTFIVFDGCIGLTVELVCKLAASPHLRKVKLSGLTGWSSIQDAELRRKISNGVTLVSDNWAPPFP